MTRFRGDTYPFTYVLSTVDNDVETPYDLSDVATAEFSYNKQVGNSVSISATIPDATNGELVFTPTQSDFDTAGTFTFDIQLTYADGTKRTVAKDRLTIEDDINKL